MIIIEASEARVNTRMPQSVIDASQIVDGLEALTGADMLISRLSTPALPDKLTGAVPHRRLLKAHTDNGVLVQRKDGRDLLNSIPELCRIQKRMLDWRGSIPPWLLVIGEFTATRSGQTLVNGDAPTPSTYWASFTGALDWWQLRGGGVTILPRAGLISGWVKKWHEDRLHRLNDSPERIVSDLPPTQGLKDAEWWDKLSIVPGIGPDKARIIAEWIPDEPQYRSLAFALDMLTCYKNDLPKGIGPGTIKTIREFFGLAPDQGLTIKQESEEL